MKNLSRLLDTLLAYAISLAGTDVYGLADDPETLPRWRRAERFRPRFV